MMPHNKLLKLKMAFACSSMLHSGKLAARNFAQTFGDTLVMRNFRGEITALLKRSLLLFAPIILISSYAMASGGKGRERVFPSTNRSRPILSRSGGRYGYTRYGAMVSTSQVISLYAGAAFKIDPSDDEKICVIADAGLNGVKLKIGIPNVYRRGEMATSNLFASFLHTWDDVLGMTKKGKDYVGIEWEEQLTIIPIQLGVYLSVDGEKEGRDILASFGIGFGL